MNEFGEYLKELRGGKSLREMERITGLSHTYLSTLEKGVDPRSGKERKPTPDILKKLSEALDVPYMSLMRKAGYIDETTLDFINDFESNGLQELKKVKLKDILNEILDETNFSIDALAKKLNTNPTSLHQILRGDKNYKPSPFFLMGISSITDIPFGYLKVLSDFEFNPAIAQDDPENSLLLGILKTSELFEINTLEEFKKYHLSKTGSIEFAQDLYHDFLKMRELEFIHRTKAFASEEINLADLESLLKVNPFTLHYYGRKLSQNDLQKILSRIEEMKDEFEYQD